MRNPSFPRRPLLVFGALTALPALARGASPSTLFHIARSKNENRVLYDARLDARGRLDRDAPLDVYWRMDAEDGRREELTALERRLAYGVTVRNVSTSGVVTVTIVAAPRPIRLANVAGKLRATTRSDGREARLVSIFVQARETLLLPEVEFVDLVGFVGETRVEERVRP